MRFPQGNIVVDLTLSDDEDIIDPMGFNFDHAGSFEGVIDLTAGETDDKL